MIRFAIVVLLLSCVVVGAAYPHDPAFSWSVARVERGVLRIEATLAGETAMTLIGTPSGSAAIPPDATTVYAPLNAAIKAGRFYRILDGDRILPVVSATTSYDGDDAFHLVVEYDAPQSIEVRFEAVFLQELSPEHRTSLMIFAGGRNAVGGGRPTRDRPAVSALIPRSPETESEMRFE